MTTDEIMQVALDLAGFQRIPEDSAVYVPGQQIRRVLFGVDVGAAELLLARQLGVDLVIAHHPVQATPDVWKLFLRHATYMMEQGVPEDEALAAVSGRVEALRLRAHGANYDHVPSVARLLGVPFMNVHAPLDEVGRRRMRAQVDAALALARPTVADVVAALRDLPEVRAARTDVLIALGEPDRPVRKVVVGHGAYTNGGAAVARTCFAHGVDVVVYIHIDPAELAQLRQEDRGNLVVVGHLAGDSLGFTPFLQALRERGLDVTTFSGVIIP